MNEIRAVIDRAYKLICSIHLKTPRHGLQRRQSDTISGLDVSVGISRIDGGFLGVDNFESRGFPSLITQLNKPQTLAGQFGRLPKTVHRLARSQSLIVVSIQVRNDLALGQRQLSACQLFMRLCLPDFAASGSPIEYGNGEIAGDKVPRIRQHSLFLVRGNSAFQSKRICLDTVNAVDRERRQVSLAGSPHIETCLLQRLLGSSKIRVLPLRGGLEVGKRRQRPRRIEIVNNREIFVQRGKQQYGKIEPRIFHRQSRFLERGSLLLILNLRFDDIGVRSLPGLFLPLRHVQKALSALQRVLGGRVLSLVCGQRVIVARDGDRQPALCDFDLRQCNSLRGFRAADIGLHECVGIELLMQDAPLAINVHTVIGDKTAAWQDAVSLRTEVLCRVAYGRQQRLLRLRAILARRCRIRDSRLNIEVELLRSFQRILEREYQRGRRFSLRVGQLQRLWRSDVLPVQRKHKENTDCQNL